MHIENTRVAAHDALGEAYRMVVLDAPRIAGDVQPGQFVHLKVPQLDGAVLRRPFSVFKAEDGRLSIVYKTVGRGTRAMAGLRPGDAVSVMGPLGRGFPMDRTGTLPVLVAGGYGMAPLYFLARRLGVKGRVFVGGRTAGDILCQADFEALGWPVSVTTEDGSLGAAGLVTAALDAWLAERPAGGPAPEFYACGPDGLLRAVAQRALAAGQTAWLSMDRRMGCGIGACLACVIRVRRDAVESWQRVCRDGPVFEAREVVWENGEAGP